MFSRPHLTITVFIALVWVPALAAEPSFPYEAIVSTDNAAVRSGNSETFYATNHLSRETRVIVHRHDPGGWRMIGPPADAFSLIPAGRVQKLDANTGRIVGNDVCTRVGSHLQPGFEVEQIPLRFGTRVELLVDQPSPTGWIAIRPPRGEFRWMRAEDLRPAEQTSASAIDEDGAEAGNGRSPAEPPASEATGAMSAFDTLAELDRQLAGLNDETPADWPLETLAFGYLRLKRFHLDKAEEIETALARIADLQQVRNHRLGLTSRGDGFQTPAVRTGETPLPEPAPKAVATTGPSARTAHRPPSVLQSHDSGERAETRTPTERVPAFPSEYYPTNINSLPAKRPTEAPPNRPPENAREPSTADHPQARRFDAVGYLQRAIDPPAGAPAYVLVSREGEILAYLQVPASASIERYVGYPMGIDGQRKQVANLGLPVIAVERLTPVRF